MRGTPTTPATKIAAAVDRIARAQRAARQAVATEHGLTPLQLDLLTVLAAGPPPEPTVGLLAVEVAVSQPTATDSLRALAEKGLVERRPDRTDRRRTTIALTRAGRHLAAGLHRAGDVVADAVAGLPAADQEATLAALLATIAELVEAGAIDVARTCTTCRFHEQADGGHHCTLIGADLPVVDLRVDCAEHEAA